MFAITEDNGKQIQLAFQNNSSLVTLIQWPQKRGHNYVERLQYKKTQNKQT
jgi:hypothetical protein